MGGRRRALRRSRGELRRSTQAPWDGIGIGRNAGAVLLTGDMWHLAESRQRQLVPTFNVDRAQTIASMEKVERLAAETNALVVRQHVQEDFDALPRFPEALN